MAEFTEVMEQRQRMCDEMESCSVCRLNSGCFTFMKKRPKEAEEIIMRWAEEHPIQTNADKFKDVFKEVFGIKLGDGLHSCELIKCSREADCETCKYKGFWQKEYEKPKGEE